MGERRSRSGQTEWSRQGRKWGERAWKRSTVAAEGSPNESSSASNADVSHVKSSLSHTSALTPPRCAGGEPPSLTPAQSNGGRVGQTMPSRETEIKTRHRLRIKNKKQKIPPTLSAALEMFADRSGVRDRGGGTE